jgi:hypothetical protein
MSESGRSGSGQTYRVAEKADLVGHMVRAGAETVGHVSQRLERNLYILLHEGAALSGARKLASPLL